MLGNYFYHQIVRKTVIAFGTLFNDIHVRHDDGAGNVISDLKGLVIVKNSRTDLILKSQ